MTTREKKADGNDEKASGPAHPPEPPTTLAEWVESYYGALIVPFGCPCDKTQDIVCPLHAALRPQVEPPQPTSPIPLNDYQQRAIKQWAADDRLWTTQETVEINLRTFARAIMATATPPVVAPPPLPTAQEKEERMQQPLGADGSERLPIPDALLVALNQPMIASVVSPNAARCYLPLKGLAVVRELSYDMAGRRVTNFIKLSVSPGIDGVSMAVRIAGALSMPAASPWHPIASAPKDGTPEPLRKMGWRKGICLTCGEPCSDRFPRCKDCSRNLSVPPPPSTEQG